MPVLGVRDGQEWTVLDLARGRGPGRARRGAAAALRAVLVTLLAPTPAPPPGAGGAGGARVIVPAEDLAALLGPHHRADECPAGLRAATDLDTALRELGTTITTRAHHPDRSWPVVVLVAQVPTRHTARLQAVLDNGARLGVLGVLLGQ